NVDGNYSINLWSGIGKKLKKLNLEFYAGPSGNFSKMAVIVNNKLSYSKNLNLGASMRLARIVDKKYELTLQNAFSYNQNKNPQAAQTFRFNTNSLNLEGALFYKKVW